MITLDQFVAILPQCNEPEEWCEIIASELPEWGFETREQVAGFIAQTAHESSSYNILAENLNYSGDRLAVVFPKYFKNVDVKPYHRNPQAIANRVYANRMGNGNADSGDGYRFRGRGVLQVTGKANYMHCSQELFGQEEVLLDDPDLLLHKPNALGSALWFWKANNLLSVTDFILLTKKINGGTIGLEHRQSIYNKALSIL
jgi:putative chitinase